MDTLLQIPQEPLLVDLFHIWEERPKATLIRDLSARKTATTEELLYDVLTVREHLHDSFNEEVQRQLRDPDTDVFVAILADQGYGFVVLALAIYSLGAVFVPLSPHVLPEEAKYFLQLCDSVLLTTVPDLAEQAQLISNTVGTKIFTFDHTLSQIPFKPVYKLDSEGSMINPEKGMVLLYTSGSTGPPKGVLHSRKGVAVAVKSNTKLLRMTPNDTCLHNAPVHWMGGFSLIFFTLFAGACTEFCKAFFNPSWLLERLRSPGATCLYMPPSLLDIMAKKLAVVKSTCSQSHYEEVLGGFRGLRLLLSGAMNIGQRQRTVWADIRGGRPLGEIYSMTEILSLVAFTDWDSHTDIPSGSCGTPNEGISVKIDTKGEICVKSEARFKKYLSTNPDIMNGVFDSDGFYKTGDVGKFDGEFLFVLGRASHDVIRYYAWKIYAPELESTLTEHPQITQAIVLGVSDPLTGQRVAALLVVNNTDENSTPDLDLQNLRKWLAIDKGIAVSKLPTLLRIVRNGERIPLTDSGKPVKPKIRDLFFNEMAVFSPRVEVWDLGRKDEGVEGARPFDWAGIQGGDGGGLLPA